MFKKLNPKLNKVFNKTFADILFSIEVRVIRQIYRWLSLHPSSAPFLSGDTYKKLSTFEYLGGDIDLARPEIIFTSTDRVHELSKALVNVKENFILITHHSDRSVDSSYQLLADNPKLIRWYAQNNEYPHHKIVPIPIGLEDRWRHNNGIVRDFRLLRANLIKKKPRILYGFTIANNVSERVPALAALRNTQIADEFMGSSRKYRKTLSEYMFVASPTGNGIDCHRTWEALYLGVIPVVIKRKFHEQFRDLPLLIVDSWSDLAHYCDSDLKAIYQEQTVKLENLEFIWFDFWRKSIESDFNPIK
jgi:hypothetical protein